MQPRIRTRIKYQRVQPKTFTEKKVTGVIHGLPEIISSITKFYVATETGIIKFQCNKGVADYVSFLSVKTCVLVEYIEKEDNVCVALFVKEI